MLINISPDRVTMGIRAARMIANEIHKKNSFVLGLATGNTPLPMYNELVRLHKEEGLSFSRVKTFNLDEYIGLTPDNPRSYHYYMFENFIKHIDIPSKNIHIPEGMAVDKEAVGPEYEEEINKAGGIDIQVLGIGKNGHIGFNEPGSSLGSLTRTKYLSETTRKEAVKEFGSLDNVPKEVITMGCGSILNSRHIIILASGTEKAKVIKAAFEGPITTMCPASILQLHRNVTAILTKNAASQLTLPVEDIPEI
jgi:glucosamine-6-phosphate deaminase